MSQDNNFVEDNVHAPTSPKIATVTPIALGAVAQADIGAPDASLQQALAQARAFLNAGHPGKALEFLRAAGQDHPSSSESCVLFAIAQWRAGERAPAIGLLESWLSGRPEDVEALRTLGHCLEKGGRLEQARIMYLRAQQLAPHPAIAAKLAQLEARLRQPVPPPGATQPAAASPQTDPGAQPVPPRPRPPHREAGNRPRLNTDHSAETVKPADPQIQDSKPKPEGKYRLGLWRDFSDIVAMLITAGHIVLPIIAFRQGFHQHPLPALWSNEVTPVLEKFWSYITPWVNHDILFSFLVIPLALCLMTFVRYHATKPRDGEELVFSDTRRIWSYHEIWIPLSLFTTGSLWGNLHHYRLVTIILGVLACVWFIRCLWLFVPGVRTQIRLFRNPRKPSLNRLVITGHIFHQIELLPLQIAAAYLNASLWRAYTMSEAITLFLVNGETLRLEAPSSNIGTRRLLSEINSLVNEGKTLIAKH